MFSEPIGTAQRRGLVTYQEIAKLIRLPLYGSYMGSTIGEIADEISADQHNAGRPLLSSILVNTTGKPGAGFFELGRILGKLDSTDRDAELDYWESEKRTTYETWRTILPK